MNVRKTLLVIGALLAILLVAGGAWFWQMMGAPLYEPGMAADEALLRGPLDPPEQTQGTGRFRVEADIELRQFSVGEGRNILIVHGGPGQPFNEPLAGLAPLGADHRLVYYDQRGCGRSTRPLDRFESNNVYANLQELDRSLGIAAQLADIERIRRILGEERLILLGHSFGGFLAALYAVEFPDRVEKLVLVAPADVLVLPGSDGGLLDEIGRRLPQEQATAYSDFLREYLDFGSLFSNSELQMAALNDRFAGFFLEAAGKENIPAAVKPDPESTGGWVVHAQYASMGMRHDYRDALRGVTAETLVLHGAADLLAPRASKQYADLIDNARFEVIEGAGHFFLFEESETVTSLLRGFISDSSTGGSNG